MATKPSELNKFLSLKKSISALHKDIAFLKKCREHRLTPNSHRIKVTTRRTPTCIVKSMEMEWLKRSINNLYGKLTKITLECYNLHLRLAKQYPEGFSLFLTKVKVAEKCEAERKRKLTHKKFLLLKHHQLATRTPVPSVHIIEDFVVNRSSAQFTPDQMNLLNNGLNYAITTPPNIAQIITDVESAIKVSDLSPAQISDARTTIANVISNPLPPTKNNEILLTKELKNKPVYYIKADKGNKTVIMDKTDYDAQMMDKINNGPYRRQRTDPLDDITKKVDKTIKECKATLGEGITKLRVSNPTLPRIRGQPKVHKPGNEMREIVSAIGSPTEKIAKWLVQEFQSMPTKPKSRSVTSSKDFVEQLQNSGNIADNEIMVSFDVTALFPSIPVKESISILEDWLLTQHNSAIWKNKVRCYLKMTRLCMEENFFKFRGDFYKQTKGAPMGNPLSPFLCEMFMANFENKLEEKMVLPDRWWRYVDDIFTVINKDQLSTILHTINSEHKDIRFTFEQEKDGQLPFLDILVLRTESNYHFEIYRKPTNTYRVIPSTSNHSHQQKMAAFHHMIHRMQSIPLSDEGKQKELEHIFETARLNGYSPQRIQYIIDKHAKTRYQQSLTTLKPTNDDLRRVSVEYDPNMTKTLSHRMRKFGFDLVFTSRHSQLKTCLGSTKDPVELLRKAGIYEISCPHCDKVYIGQTKRNLKTRFKEHLAETVKAHKDTEKGITHHFQSKVAEHVFNEGHQLTTNDIKILQRTPPWKLDVAESIEIYKKTKNTLINKDQGNGYSWLFKYIRPPPSKPRQHNDSTQQQTTPPPQRQVAQ